VKNPWTNVYGSARTLVALGTLLTLLSNSSRTLFYPALRSISEQPTTLVSMTLFGLLRHHLELARFLSICGLLLVASGWRPRFTGVLHWWIAWSFFLNCVPADGGDQVAHVLSLLLLPVTLTDPRRWHWSEAPEIRSLPGTLLSRVALSAIFMIRIQGAVIYFNSAVGKFAVPEWMNGTALYYWLLDPRIGFATRHHDMLLAVLKPAWSVALLTWVPIVLELALCFTLAMSSNNPLRKPLLLFGFVFHACNILFFGLVSFFFSMAGVLVMMVRPIEQPFAFGWIQSRWEGFVLELKARVRTLAPRVRE
jgi:antimicrobial peptide system SdpB family protein